MTGAIGIVAGTCGTEPVTFENGSVTSGVEPDASGAADIKEESIGSSTCLIDGTRTGDPEFDRDGV